MKKFSFRLDSVISYENYRKSIIENELTRLATDYNAKKENELKEQKVLASKINKYYEYLKDSKTNDVEVFIRLQNIKQFKQYEKNKNIDYFHQLGSKLSNLKLKWMVHYKKVYTMKNYRQTAYDEFKKKLDKEEDQNLSEIYLNQSKIQEKLNNR